MSENVVKVVLELPGNVYLALKMMVEPFGYTIEEYLAEEIVKDIEGSCGSNLESLVAPYKEKILNILGNKETWDIQLSDELYERVEKVSRRLGISPNQFVIDAVHKGITGGF
jgi:predicted DNA-binding protein